LSVTPDAGQVGAETPNGQELESASVSPAPPTAEAGKTQDAGGNAETGEMPPVPPSQPYGERPTGDAQSPPEGEDHGPGNDKPAKRGRAAANRQAAQKPAPQATEAPGQNNPQVLPLPQPTAALAQAAEAAAAGNSLPLQDPAGNPETTGVDGIQRTAGDRTSPPSGNPSSQDSTEVTQADRVRFVQRVARAFESVGERGGSIRLKLHPPELGSLRLEVTVRNGVMNARLEAETQTAQSMLLEHLPALRERLAEQNIRIERFDVDLAGQSPGGSTDGADAQARSRQGHAQHRPHDHRQTEAGAERVAGLRRSMATGSSSQFDVII